MYRYPFASQRDRFIPLKFQITPRRLEGCRAIVKMQALRLAPGMELPDRNAARWFNPIDGSGVLVLRWAERN